ncbi:Multidrug resistance protein MdtB [Alteripontixanthobacter maritimus]|uniref:Multidrug resistance protein MdtB n=1 Tax=Alteripontixanthobacter maritimus TaxID=2161824 RepID=A0A369Q878_9SPHN|nr:efflux RND transporter permease subunit [Alteripontixanthobacter maritimus]RDC61091.1 Multidrug resistance protein MdtB [Alteripontixanthobacter maritimus]
MDFSQISAWSIRNPVVPIVLFVGLMIAGLMAFSGMKVQDNPDVEFPMVIVGISQPGAAPVEIENQITQRVESALQGVEGVENLNSTASEGFTQTMVEFEIGTDIAQAVNEVKAAVDQIRGELPDGILEPRVFRAQTSSEPIGYFAVVAPNLTLEQLSYFIDDTITKRLTSIEGMAEVGRGGGVNREILVTLDPGRMQSFGVTASQINGALRQTNVNAAGGAVEIAGSRQSVRVLGNEKTAYDLSQARISLGGGRTIKLTDVADVSDSYGEITRIGKIAGKPVVTFSVTRARGASDVAVYDKTLAELDKIEAENPGITFTRLFTSVDYTKGQYESSLAAMIEGAILAVVVVFFFLRDWRATIIAALAIPLSAIPTFWFMDLLGFTLNTLSLLALGLVAGVLVDDAIVEIENIVRHMRMGKSAYQASIDAADEIGLPVVATTFSIVAVFLPVGLMPGVSGQFFKNFGLTVVVSVLMSLAVARMITPMVAAYFLEAKGTGSHGEGPMMDRYERLLRWTLDRSGADRVRDTLQPVRSHWWYWPLVSVLFTLIGAGALAAFGGALYGLGQVAGEATDIAFWKTRMAELPDIAGQLIGFVFAFTSMLLGVAIAAVVGFAAGWLLASVVRVLAKVLMGKQLGGFYAYRAGHFRARLRDHRSWMMGVGGGALLLTGLVAINLPTQFFPTFDSDFSRIRIEMVPGTTLAQTERVADRVDRIVNERPEVEAALLSVGEGNARLFITLSEDREKSQQEFEREVTPLLQGIPDARISFQGQGGGGGTGRPISVMLSGSDPELLEETANTLVTQMADVSGVVAPRVEADMQRPEIIITPRADLAASLGVTTAALSQTIRIATIGDIDQNAAKFSLSDRQVPIRVRLPVEARRDLSSIANLPVPTSSGGSVPLSRIAEIGFGSGPTAIQRYNQQRRIFVGADLAPGVAQGDAVTAINKLPIMQDLPPGVTNAPFGDQQWQQEMMDSFEVALGAGVLLVFAVLVLLYRRFVSPLVNMGSLFLAPLGGLIAIWMIGQPVSMPVFIGVLMLFGIVAKNSILLIDFAIEEVERGTPKYEAIVEAGRKRAQPIVMTTVAMTAGMIPTALSLSGDGAFRAPMGTVVIGGLILSTLLTLLIVPAGFSLADGMERRLGPWLRTRFLTFKPGDDDYEDPTRSPQPAE